MWNPSGFGMTQSEDEWWAKENRELWKKNVDSPAPWNRIRGVHFMN